MLELKSFEKITNDVYFSFIISILLLFLSELIKIFIHLNIIKEIAGLINIFALFLLINSVWKWFKLKVNDHKNYKTVYHSEEVVKSFNNKGLIKIMLYLLFLLLLSIIIGNSLNLFIPANENWLWLYATISVVMLIDFILRKKLNQKRF